MPLFAIGMWMADKPNYQERLAKRLADIGRDLYTASPTAGLQYLEAFWETLCREWSGLDRHRLDKFYLLLRAGYQVTMTLHKLGASMKAVQEMLLRWPLSPVSSSVPDAIAIYGLENFPNILKEAECTPKEATALVTEVLIPLAAHARKASVLRTVRNFFGELAATNEFQVDWDQVAKVALATGAEPTVASSNRTILYRIGQQKRPASK